MSQSQTCHITVTAMRRKVIALGPRLPWNKEELLLELAGKLYVLASRQQLQAKPESMWLVQWWSC